MQNTALEKWFWAKLNLNYHSNEMIGILFNIILTFDRVAQNATNDRSYYECLKNEGIVVYWISVVKVRQI